MYKVVWLTRATKNLRRIDKRYQQRIWQSVGKELTNFPHASHIKRLSGSDTWRMRVGDYRVLFTVDNDEIKIITITDVMRRTSSTY